MKTMSAKEAKNEFGLLLDTARVEHVTIEKHGRTVAVILSVEEYGRLVRQHKARGKVYSARKMADKSNR